MRFAARIFLLLFAVGCTIFTLVVNVESNRERVQSLSKRVDELQKTVIVLSEGHKVFSESLHEHHELVMTLAENSLEMDRRTKGIMSIVGDLWFDLLRLKNERASFQGL